MKKETVWPAQGSNQGIRQESLENKGGLKKRRRQWKFGSKLLMNIPLNHKIQKYICIVRLSISVALIYFANCNYNIKHNA